MRKLVIFTFAVAIHFALPAQDSISFTTWADTNVILLGEQFKLTLSASVPEETAFEWPLWEDTVSGLELLEVSKLDTTADKGYWQINQHFTFTSFDSGFVFIPPLEVKVKGQRYSSQAFPITVKFPEISEEQDYYDIKDPLDVPLDWWLILKWVGIISLALALIGGLIYRLFFHNKRVAQLREQKKMLPPFEYAMLMLEELESKKLWQSGKLKEYHSELTDILRVFLERQFAINAMESTASEVYEKTRRLRIPEQLDEDLKEMLSLSELVKYAKEKPGQLENEKSFATVKTFLLHYKPEPEKEEKQDGVRISES